MYKALYYYKYLLNPILLLISIMIIMVITIYNFQLGLILTISLITLYYPAKYYYKNDQLENYEPFITGFKEDQKTLARPVHFLFLEDGTMQECEMRPETPPDAEKDELDDFDLPPVKPPKIFVSFTAKGDLKKYILR